MIAQTSEALHPVACTARSDRSARTGATRVRTRFVLE